MRCLKLVHNLVVRASLLLLIKFTFFDLVTYDFQIYDLFIIIIFYPNPNYNFQFTKVGKYNSLAVHNLIFVNQRLLRH